MTKLGQIIRKADLTTWSESKLRMTLRTLDRAAARGHEDKASVKLVIAELKQRGIK